MVHNEMMDDGWMVNNDEWMMRQDAGCLVLYDSF